MPGKNLSIRINRLKIVDCADDDEDMDLRLSIYVKRQAETMTWSTKDPTELVESRVFNKENIDVYVEEEGKIGNESKCVFFGGERVDGLNGVEEVRIDVDLNTRDGDGFNWGGHHNHVKSTAGLNQGVHDFEEGKQHSHNPNTEGEYALSYTLIIH